MLKYAFTLLLFLSANSVQAKSIPEKAKPIPGSQWTESSKLYAAQACYAEAGFYEPDCGEILWVLATRWQRVQTFRYRDPGTREIRLWQFSDMIKEYVSALTPKKTLYERLSIRQREIRKFPWGTLLATPDHVLRFSPKASVKRFNFRWASLRKLVEEWFMGRIKQHCPGASHWGAPYGKDIARARRAQLQGRWIKVECSIDTKNDFWMNTRKPKHLIAYR